MLSQLTINQFITVNELVQIDQDSFSTELKSQKNQLDRLLNQRRTSKPCGKRYYLNTYDAIFRIVEIKLLNDWSTRLNRNPHKVTKNIIFELFPELTWVLSKDQFNALVSVRHEAKKNNVPPSADSTSLLDTVLDTIKASDVSS